MMDAFMSTNMKPRRVDRDDLALALLLVVAGVLAMAADLSDGQFGARFTFGALLLAFASYVARDALLRNR